MKLRVLLPVAFATLLVACGKEQSPAPPAPVAAPAPVAVPDLPPPQEIGDSCSKDCGNGARAEIQCAEGETPVCDCAATPNASCQPPKPAG